MATLLLELVVEMEDGTTHTVVADQRDVARWEVQDFGCPFGDLASRMHLAYRWLGWSALSRRGLTELSWADFDAQCVEVTDPPEPEDPDEPSEALDPGQPVPSASASPRSRGGRANR